MLNLIKLCVGCGSVEELVSWRAERRHFVSGLEGEFNVHRTRMMPKRAAEIAGKGSLYWVIAGKIQARQVIKALVPATDAEGKSCCDIVMDPGVVRTVPQPKRPFQGWRYLRPADVPLDLPGNGEGDEGPLLAELSHLGLL